MDTIGMLADLQYYQCPRCGGHLVPCLESVPNLGCICCGATFPVANGVVDFSDENPRFLSGDREYDEGIVGIVDNALAGGWFNAIMRYDRAHGATSRQDYATALSRVDFKFLLPLRAGAQVLDIGGGHGLIATAFSRTCAKVFTIEKVHSQAQFIALRALQESLKNVSVACGGANCKFPYRSAIFDIILANGVFEWVGHETSFENVRSRQCAFLTEMRRMLKPGGTIWLTTKNRYSISIVFSRVANNNYLGLLSVLPNRLFNAISMLSGRGEYLSGLRSMHGYVRQFASCGLETAGIWVPNPSVRYPTEIVPYRHGRRSVSATNYRHAGVVSRALGMGMPWPIAKWFTLNYAFLLRARSSPMASLPSIISRIADAHEETRGGRILSLFCPASSSITSSVIAAVDHSSGCHIIKLSRYTSGNLLERECKAIGDVMQIAGSYANLLPEVSSHGYIEGFQYSIMKRYGGISAWSNVVSRRVTHWFVRDRLSTQLLAFLTQLARVSMAENCLPFHESVEVPLQKLISDKPNLSALASWCQRTAMDAWKSLPLTYSHNDMHAGNILIRRVWPLDFKILDWESATRYGLPCVDLWLSATSLGLSRDAVSGLMASYCNELGIDRKLFPCLTLLALAQSRVSWGSDHEIKRTSEWIFRNAAFDRKVMGIQTEIDSA